MVTRLNDEDPKRVLIVKSGAYGDLLMLTPSIRRFKEVYPDCHVSVACLNQYKPILLNSVVDELVDYPVNELDITRNGYDCIIYIENAIEGNDEANTMHGVDALALQMGLSPILNKRPVYEVTEFEAEWAKARYPRNEQKRVAVHVSASMPNRNYPEALMTQVIIDLIRKGYEVFLLGAPAQWRVKNVKGLTNLMLENLDIRKSIAAMATCDVLLAPDSVMLHVASAIGMKGVGLFGPVPWSTRVTSDKIHCLQGTTGCTPCCFAGDAFTGPYPAHCPSKTKNMCALLADIKPERIVTKVQLLLK